MSAEARCNLPSGTGDRGALPALLDGDMHDETLIRNVRPPEWVNPSPAARYNLVVIGAGSAGLVTAAAAAGLGARVAIVERSLMGGDCLNHGCVPSKALLRAARAVGDVRVARELGIDTGAEARVDFSAVMQRVRRLRSEISGHDSAERFRKLGVDVFLGHGRFVGPDALEVDGRHLRFARACIATGARASAPPIPGLEHSGYLTNENVFSLTERPSSLAVIGGGPIGCELAQAFARLGSKVVLLEALPRVLPRDDEDAARLVAEALERDGVDLRTGIRVIEVEGGPGDTRVVVEGPGGVQTFEVERMLLAVGRQPNVDGLDLEAAGVEYDRRSGIEVDDRLRTSNRRIFAAGDIATGLRFTHMADAMARIVVRNALFAGRARASSLIIPWVTFTDPEVAHVGLTPQQASERGIEIETIVQQFGSVDRGVLDGETEGFAKVHHHRGRDEIVGATVVARHAGEMIGEMSLAIGARLGLARISATIHPYPTQAEAFRKLGDEWNRSRLTPRVAKLIRAWLAWRRR